MDIFKYVETVLGRELNTLEKRVVRAVRLARASNPEWKPKATWSAPDKARYEQLAPIVDKYLQERANA